MDVRILKKKKINDYKQITKDSLFVKYFREKLQKILIKYKTSQYGDFVIDLA